MSICQICCNGWWITSAFKNGVNNSVSNGTVIGAVGDYLNYKTIKVDHW